MPLCYRYWPATYLHTYLGTCLVGDSLPGSILLVRTRLTKFLDDPKRLAVATTRARQVEIYVMPIPMTDRLSTTTTYLSQILEACRNRSQGLRA